MNYKLIFALLLLLFFGCNSDEPENLIDKDKMTSILIEMHIAEAKVNTLGLGADSTEVVIEMMTDRILQDFGYTTEEYLQSYNYYMQDVRVMENLYSRVVDSLSLREEISNTENE